METKQATENLQVIRTLMERSAVYRRELAPIMLFAGGAGVLAAATGLWFRLTSASAFGWLWLVTALLAVAGAFLIARRQALQAGEAFWSPPTRRVAQALLPPLLAGLCLGGGPLFIGQAGAEIAQRSALAWILCYGCALHAAGFFMPRGIKVFGWLFMGSACGLYYAFRASGIQHDATQAHWLMGAFFGGLHLAYGGYLYLTERENPVA
ncbi:MAG: hypothetical protein WCS94_24185 [Verrucomicrobiota bacterium]